MIEFAEGLEEKHRKKKTSKHNPKIIDLSSNGTRVGPRGWQGKAWGKSRSLREHRGVGMHVSRGGDQGLSLNMLMLRCSRGATEKMVGYMSLDFRRSQA